MKLKFIDQIDENWRFVTTLEVILLQFVLNQSQIEEKFIKKR